MCVCFKIQYLVPTLILYAIPNNLIQGQNERFLRIQPSKFEVQYFEVQISKKATSKQQNANSSSIPKFNSHHQPNHFDRPNVSLTLSNTDSNNVLKCENFTET